MFEPVDVVDEHDGEREMSFDVWGSVLLHAHILQPLLKVIANINDLTKPLLVDVTVLACRIVRFRPDLCDRLLGAVHSL